MTSHQLFLVKYTWKLLREVDSYVLGSVFYGRLFMTYPNLRSLFKNSLESQHKKFVEMLSIIVARLDRPDVLSDEMRQLAQRHLEYGVKPEHYQPVGEALLWTLEQGLGKDWNTEVKEAWSTCYTIITQAMLAKT